MRYPAVAGRFYPSDNGELIDEIRYCFTHPLGPGDIGPCSGKRSVRGIIVPHAGYQCSGMNAAHAFKRVAEDGRPEAYIVIGPDHYGIPFDIALCSESYLTPLGECHVHEEIIRHLSTYYEDSPESHTEEHSIEVEVPFLQYIDPGAKIVPIIMGDQDAGAAVELGKRIRTACKGHDVIIIASSDMCHYIPKADAEYRDMKFLDKAVVSDIPGMYKAIEEYGISACGYGPIAAMITAISPSKGTLLKHTDSWDSIHYQKNSVVGYASAVFE